MSRSTQRLAARRRGSRHLQRSAYAWFTGVLTPTQTPQQKRVAARQEEKDTLFTPLRRALKQTTEQEVEKRRLREEALFRRVLVDSAAAEGPRVHVDAGAYALGAAYRPPDCPLCLLLHAVQFEAPPPRLEGFQRGERVILVGRCRDR